MPSSMRSAGTSASGQPACAAALVEGQRESEKDARVGSFYIGVATCPMAHPSGRPTHQSIGATEVPMVALLALSVAVGIAGATPLWAPNFSGVLHA